MAKSRRKTTSQASPASRLPNTQAMVAPLSKAELIWQVVHAIPAGNVCTYGEVARRAGLPGYARYVGTTLSKLPEGSSLPWFRVLNSQGRISFPAGSNAYNAQVQRLQSDGIAVIDGKVDLKRFLWQA